MPPGQADRWAVGQAAWLLEIDTESLRGGGGGGGGGACFEKGGMMGQFFLKSI